MSAPADANVEPAEVDAALHPDDAPVLPGRLLAGRVGVVTGAGSGLGRAIARALAASGVRVVVADIDADGSRATVERIEADGGEAEAAELDVSDARAVEELVERLSGEHGAAFDLLVSNAGTDRGADLPDVDDDQWHRVFEVNLHGPMYLGRAFVRHLQKHGADDTVADVVTICSISALTVGAGAGAYNSSKAAMRKLAEVMQTEARERAWPARVSIIDPAAMDTPMMEQWGLPAGRMMDPRAVAGLVVTAITLPPSVVLQSAVITPRVEQYPR